jgi:hypothetical protein
MQTENKNFAVTKSIPYSIFEAMVVGAYEGGSHYWAAVDASEFKAMLPKVNDKAPSEKIALALYTNPDFKMNVYDCESDGEVLGVVTQESCIKAFTLMAEQHTSHFDDMLSGNDDATTADIFFQLATLGEVQYG